MVKIKFKKWNRPKMQDILTLIIPFIFWWKSVKATLLMLNQVKQEQKS
jgi:hypothetical protein